ncbi:MAG: sulfatase [Terriglobales bacterium]
MDKSSVTRPCNAGSLLILGLGSGIFAGLVEGAGLLFFQRVNWARWGPMIHVSGEILWISPIVDVILFLSLALIGSAVARFSSRFPAVRVLVFLLTFFSLYDWLTLTGRLYHRACLLLALGVAAAFARWCGQREKAFLKFGKRATPWILALWIFVFTGMQGGKRLQERNAVAHLPAAAPDAPNVLVIVEDTLRADHVSAYGYARPTSPNFDRLAQQGVRFENAISTTSWSLPSHISLLTGRYQFEHGIGNVQPAPWLGWGRTGLGGFPTLGEMLEQRGYRTGAFSANRTYFSTSLGFGRGFQHFEDYFHSPADMFIRTLYGREFARIYLNRTDRSKVKRALRYFGMNSMLDKDSEGSGNYGGAQGVRKRADVVNHEVLSWIDRENTDHGRNDRGETHPFFAFLNYFDVHYPYGSPPTYPKPEWDHGGRIDEYDASVKYADDALGRLMQALDQRGLSPNTLVIVTSDHGESLGQHGLTYHGQALYRELIHVPLAIFYPGHVPTGVKVQTPITNAAIPATIMDILGARTQQDAFPCPSLSALWQTGGGSDWPDPVSELARNDIADKEDRAAAKIVPTATTGSMKSLVTPQWQFITHESMGDQLYDWARDTAESNNLIHSPEGQTTAARLKSRLENVMRPVK